MSELLVFGITKYVYCISVQAFKNPEYIILWLFYKNISENWSYFRATDKLHLTLVWKNTHRHTFSTFSRIIKKTYSVIHQNFHIIGKCSKRLWVIWEYDLSVILCCLHVWNMFLFCQTGKTLLPCRCCKLLTHSCRKIEENGLGVLALLLNFISPLTRLNQYSSLSHYAWNLCLKHFFPLYCGYKIFSTRKEDGSVNNIKLTQNVMTVPYV